jgi:hypothetical protein
MKGGVVQTNLDKHEFTPIWDMLNKGSISLLTANSLKGFMIQLDVDEQYSEFKTMLNARFTLPVLSYLLKFVILYDKRNPPLERRLPSLELDGHSIGKARETPTKFLKEASTQQDVWMASIVGGKKEICPSVANTAFFTGAKTDELLQLLLSKSTEGTGLYTVLEYIRDNSEGNIGVLTMPMIEGSKTLEEFAKDLSVPATTAAAAEVARTNAVIRAAKISVLTKVVRLFLLGYIHLDLHKNNSLVVLDDKIHTWLIDFGTVYHYWDPVKGPLEGGRPLNDLRTVLQEYLLPARTTRRKVSDANESDASANHVDIILRVLTAIERCDSNNNSKYGVDYSQMRWAIPFLHDGDAALTIFNELYATQNVSTLSAEALRRKTGISDPESTPVPDFHPLQAMQATQPGTQATQPGTQATQPGTQATQPPGTQATQPPGTQATQPPGTPAGTDSIRDYLGLFANSGGKRRRKRISRRRKIIRKRSTRVRF